MTNMIDYSKQAELALAAYATLSTGEPNQANLILQAGMSSIQASHFASNWRVVKQYNDATDLSVTVFESVSDHKRYLAIRGTDT